MRASNANKTTLFERVAEGDKHAQGSYSGKLAFASWSCLCCSNSSEPPEQTSLSLYIYISEFGPSVLGKDIASGPASIRFSPGPGPFLRSRGTQNRKSTCFQIHSHSLPMLLVVRWLKSKRFGSLTKSLGIMEMQPSKLQAGEMSEMCRMSAFSEIRSAFLSAPKGHRGQRGQSQGRLGVAFSRSGGLPRS